MRPEWRRKAAAAAAAFLALLASPAAAADLVLDRASGFIVPVEVNGRTLRLRVDPGANGVIVLNPEAAERAGLRAAPLDRAMARALGIGAAPLTGDQAARAVQDMPVASGGGSRLQDSPPEAAEPRVQFGPLLARGRFGMARARIGGGESEKVFAWFENRAVLDADGLISPAELPYSAVTLRLGPARAGERTIALAGRYAPLSGFTWPLAVRGRTLNVKLSVTEPNSIATAAAGAVLAEAHRGGWTGEVRRHHIAIDIMRPVRPLALERPLSVAGMRVRSFLVRIRDHGGDLRLPESVSEDPDEILVTAPGSVQAPRFLLVLGQDQLASCSSITYERRAVRLVARCRDG